MQRARWVRLGVYLFVIFVALASWAPSLTAIARSQWEAYQLRRRVAILYTTDVQGFLESCG